MTDKKIASSLAEFLGDSHINPGEPSSEMRAGGSVAGPSKSVKTKPSGSGLAFFFDDNASGEIMSPADSDKIVERSLINTEEIDSEEDDDTADETKEESEEEEEALLTQDYLDGKLSFRDYVQQVEYDEEESIDKLWPESQAELIKSKKQKVSFDDESSDEESSGDDDENLEDRIAGFSEDLGTTTRQQLGRKRRRLGFKKRQKRLDPALQGLMGEANLRFVRGDTDMAIRMCMEVIRQDPSVAEPFQTLATLYEGLGQHDKALQFALIGAHLAPPDPEEWCRLAYLSLESGDKDQAATCFKKAIDADVTNIDYYLRRAEILEELGDKNRAIIGFKRLLANLKPGQGEPFIQGSRELARLLHSKNDIQGAKDVIEKAVEKYPDFVESGDINLLLELMISLKNYESALDVMYKFCSARFSSDLKKEEVDKLKPEDQLKAFKTVMLPDDVAVEIKSKLIVILLNLDAKHLIKDLSAEILSIDVEMYGDLMLDVAEAYVAMQDHLEALRFFELLVPSESWGKAAVWLSYAESLYELGRLDCAERAYQQVVKLAPQHHEARRTLSTILQQLGRPEEALKTLTQDEAEILNPTLLLQRCQLLLSEGKLDEFIVKTKLLLSRHSQTVRTREELVTFATRKKLSEKQKRISQVRILMKEPTEEENQPCFEKSSVSPDAEFHLLYQLCEVLFNLKRYEELQYVTFSSLSSTLFAKPEYAKELEFMALLASFFNGDCFHAYNFVRELVLKDIKNPRLWNLFNLVITKADDVRHNRFLIRLMVKHPDHSALGILNGHNCLVAGTYKYSLGEYMTAFKQDPENPLVALMLGLTFIHMACQKFSARKHSLVIQGCAFLNTYLHLRGHCQESYYNIGRAMHQLGLLPAALFYYKKTLKTKPMVDEDPQIFDLSQEAAYNMSLIYKSSGSNDLAMGFVRRHIII